MNNDEEENVKEEDINLGEVQEIDEEEAITEDETEDEVYTEEDAKKENVNKPSFIHSLLSQLVDQVVIGVISTAVLYLFDLLLRLITGYYVSEKGSVLFIIYVLVNILYVSIIEASQGSTIGKNIFETTVNKKLS